MELFLLRHGQAEEFNPSGDAARVLTEKGQRQSLRAGTLLLRMGQRPDLVLSSPRVRCQQTASLFTEAAQMPGPVVQSWLDCGMTKELAISELRAFSDFQRVLLVGHEPDFSSLVESLLGAGSGASVEVKKGALVGLWMTGSGGSAVLRFLIPPKMMRRGKSAPNASEGES